MPDRINSGPSTTLLRRANLSRVDAPLRTSEPESPRFPWNTYLRLLAHRWWQILLIGLIGGLSTYLYVERLPAIYESTATISVDYHSPSSVFGQDSSQVSPGTEQDQLLATQVELIKSDEVLRPVALRYNLLEREGQFKNKKLRREEILDAPINLRDLTVVRKPNSFLLRISYRSDDPKVSADVANAIVRSYLDRMQDIRLQSSTGLSEVMEKQIAELRVKMEQSREALAKYERDLNVVDSGDKTNILSARLLQLNQEYTTAETERLRKQAAFESARSDATSAVQLADPNNVLGKLQERIQAAEQKVETLKLTYGPNYAQYRRAASDLNLAKKQYDDTRAELVRRLRTDYRQAQQREAMVHASLASTKKDFDKLNLETLEYQQKKRDAESDKNLYDELARKVKEAGINASMQANFIRVAEAARPAAAAVAPPRHVLIALGAILSLLLACGGLVLQRFMNSGINDVDHAVRSLDAEVIAVLPLVRDRKGLAVRQAYAVESRDLTVHQSRGNRRRVQDIFFFKEAIRIMRAYLFTDASDSRNKSVLVTSAVPGEGKSTVAASLAVANAERHRKTLLIDADLRRGTQAAIFGIDRQVGLSTAILAGTPWRDVVVQVERMPDLYVLPSGPLSNTAPDLLSSTIRSLLQELGDEYDDVIIDSPPLVTFAESLEMASAVDGVLVVTRAGSTSSKTVATLFQMLDQMSIFNVKLVLNQMDQRLSNIAPPRLYRAYYTKSA